MAKILFLIVQLTFFNFAFASNEGCGTELTTLKSLCSSQELIEGGLAHFSKCSTGFSYYFSNEVEDNHFTMETAPATCKIKEIRNEKSLESKTTFISNRSEKTVVYHHTNGLSNTFVYGATGFYHISETESGDSLYDFHIYQN